MSSTQAATPSDNKAAANKPIVKQPAVNKAAVKKASKSTAERRLTNADVRQIEGALRVLQKLCKKTNVLVLIHNPGGPNCYRVHPSRPGPLHQSTGRSGSVEISRPMGTS